MRRALTVLIAVFVILVLVGTIVFAIAAQMTDPPLEPAYTLMYWQAVWDDGRYGQKYTFAVTWFCTLCALVGPLGLISMCVGPLRGAGSGPAMPAWPRLEWTRMREGARARLGFALTVVSLLFGGVCLQDPEVFTPVGFLAKLVLIFLPFTLLAGPALLLDVILPASVLRGPITALERVDAAGTQQVAQRFVTLGEQLGEQRIELPAPLWELWDQLKVGDVIALRRSGGFDRVLELARE
ncbi:MAG: hypothetical protein H0T76_10675 [Nannocystis sp.]|nr:hypothetical protein [Nannocystis sp.]MBA3546936.1 hypothetical protein [Nannocystis sp.]